MDNLRWTLLLVGAIAVVAIYFSGRFESEDWKRERKQLSRKKPGSNKSKKTRRKKFSPAQTQVPYPSIKVIKKEPRMDEVDVDPAPEQQEQKIAPSVSVPQAETVIADSVPVAALSFEGVDETLEAITSEKMPIDNKKDETVTAERSGIEDEITEIEIPVELEVVEAEIQISEAELDKKPVEVEESLDIEPLVLSVTVLANEDEKFDGLEIKEALEAESLAHGAMQIFHFHDSNNDSDTDDAVFSVANMLEPGTFDLENIDGMQTPGLMLFCQLPGPLEGEVALELMLDKGRGLAVRLHGQMCDDKRNLFTTQAKNHYLDRIAIFVREQALARSKMPTN